MKKTFKINKINNKEIVEAISDSITDILGKNDGQFDRDDDDFANRVKRRTIKAVRVAEEAERAAAIARENGNIEQAEDLERRAKDLKDWADKVWTQESDTAKEKKEINQARHRAANAASRAKQAAKDAEAVAQEKEREAEEDINDSEKQEKAKEARQAADEAKEAANEARKAEDDANDAVDIDEAKDAADRAEEAAKKAEESADKTKSESEEDENNELDDESENSDEDSDHKDDVDNSKDFGDHDSTNSGKNSENNNQSNGSDSQDSNDSNDDSSNEDSTGDDSTDSESDKDDDSNNKDNSSNSKNDSNNGDTSSDSISDEDSDAESESDIDDEESENGENGESNNDEDDEIIENPFNLDPRKIKSPANQREKKDDKEDKKNKKELTEFERILKTLKMLRGGEKDGAIAALNDVISKKINLDDEENLTEAINSSNTIDLISDDEFNRIINDNIKAIEKIKKVRKEEPRKDSIKKIDGLTNSGIFKNDLTSEDRAALRSKTEKDTQDEIQRAHILSKYASNYKPSTSFKHDLLLAIQDQIESYKEQRKSWAALNRKTMHTAVMKQGKQTITQEEPKKPSIRVYLDCSSSFDIKDIKKEEEFMSGVARLEKDGEIEKTVIKYFAEHLHDDYELARREHGTSAWDEIIEDIRKNQPANVVIVTDSDMNYYGGRFGTAPIPGIAWFIWKKDTAQNLLKDIKCKKIYQYNLI